LVLDSVEFRIVIPRAAELDPENLNRELQKLEVGYLVRVGGHTSPFWEEPEGTFKVDTTRRNEPKAHQLLRSLGYQILD